MKIHGFIFFFLILSVHSQTTQSPPKNIKTLPGVVMAIASGAADKQGSNNVLGESKNISLPEEGFPAGTPCTIHRIEEQNYFLNVVYCTKGDTGPPEEISHFTANVGPFIVTTNENQELVDGFNSLFSTSDDNQSKSKKKSQTKRVSKPTTDCMAPFKAIDDTAKCYYLSVEPKTFFGAITGCSEIGGHLAEPSVKQEDMLHLLLNLRIELHNEFELIKNNSYINSYIASPKQEQFLYIGLYETGTSDVFKFLKSGEIIDPDQEQVFTSLSSENVEAATIITLNPNMGKLDTVDDPDSNLRPYLCEGPRQQKQ